MPLFDPCDGGLKRSSRWRGLEVTPKFVFLSRFSQESNNHLVFPGLMLQKQTPSSNIPRFNPHGYQPPPVEKKKEPEPKKMTASMKFGAIKKRKDEEEITDFKKFNIEELLLDAVSNTLR